MRPWAAPLTSILVAFGSLLPLRSAAQPPDPGGELLQRERELFVALQANDRGTLEHLLDDTFVLRGYPDVSRAEWVENAIDHCWGETFTLDEFSVRQDTGTFVATFVMTFDQDPVTCEPATLRSLITDVWVQRQGTWRLLVRHASGVTVAGSADDVGRQFAAVPGPDPIWQIEAELSAVATGGNTRTQSIGSSADLRHNARGWSTTGRARFVRSTAEGIESARSTLIELRPGRELTPRVTIFARGGFRRDRFAGIEDRMAFGGGLSYELLATRTQELDVEGSIGYERERRIDAPELRFASAQSRATYRWNLTSNLTVADEASVSFDLETAADWRGSNRASLTMAVNRIFSLKFSHALEYLNDPVPGFRKRDTVTSASVVVSYRR